MRLSANLLVICALLVICPFVSAEEKIAITVEEPIILPETFIGEVTVDGLNLRAGFSTNFEILAKLNTGDKVLILSKESDWYKIKLPPQAEAYVAKPYIDQSGTAAFSKADNLNIRAGAGLSFSTIGQINKTEEIIVVGEEEDWLTIIPPAGTTGWVHSAYIKLLDLDIAKYQDIEKALLEERLKPVIVEAEVEEFPEIAEVAEGTAEELKLKTTEESEGVPYLANGQLVSSGRFFGRHGTHKLLENGLTIYHLQSDRYDLNLYRSYQVKIWGEIINTDKKNIPLVEVTKIELCP